MRHPGPGLGRAWRSGANRVSAGRLLEPEVVAGTRPGRRGLLELETALKGQSDIGPFEPQQLIIARKATDNRGRTIITRDLTAAIALPSS